MTMPAEFKFGVLTKNHCAEVHTLPLPELKEDEVLVKQEACNICTTDYGHWLGLREHQGYPMAGGHEGSGIVISKGSKVSDKIQVGDRVGVCYDYCGTCKSCRLGETNACENRKELVYSKNYLGYFGFANYAIRNSKVIIKMSNELNASEAGFLEPVATVLNAMKKIRIKSLENVVVIGAGTMGMLNAQVARAFGANVLISELMEKKIDIARNMGFNVIDANVEDPVQKVLELTDGIGADVVIVAVGATAANDQAIKMLKQLDGRILLFAAGYPAPKLNIDSNTIHYRKMELIGAFEAKLSDFYDAASLLSNRKIDVNPLIEEKYPLSRIQDAFAAASTPGNYRVSVILNE